MKYNDRLNTNYKVLFFVKFKRVNHKSLSFNSYVGNYTFAARTGALPC